MTEPPNQRENPFVPPRSESDDQAFGGGWAVRHPMVLAILLALGSAFAGFQAAELLDGHVALKRGAMGFLAMGLVMVGGDLGARKYGGEGEGVARYMRGPSLRGIPVFVVGIFFVVLAFMIRG